MKIKYKRSYQLENILFGNESSKNEDALTKRKLGNLYYQPTVECRKCKTKYHVKVESEYGAKVQAKMLETKKYYVELLDPKDCIICTRGLGDSLIMSCLSIQK